MPWNDTDGSVQKRCPAIPIRDDPFLYREYFKFYRAYQDGHLPEPGGINSQPAKFLDIVNCMGYVKSECDKVKRRQSDNKQKKPIGKR